MVGVTMWKALVLALVGWARGNMPVLAGLVRTLLAAAGGWLVSQGYVSDEDVKAVGDNLPAMLGSGLFAVSAVWSVISKLRNKGEVKNG